MLHRKNFSIAKEEKRNPSESSDEKILRMPQVRSHTSSIGTNEHIKSEVYSARNPSLLEDFNTETISSHDLTQGGYDNYIMAEIQKKYGLLSAASLSVMTDSSDI